MISKAMKDREVQSLEDKYKEFIGNNKSLLPKCQDFTSDFDMFKLDVKNFISCFSEYSGLDKIFIVVTPFSYSNDNIAYARLRFHSGKWHKTVNWSYNTPQDTMIEDMWAALKSYKVTTLLNKNLEVINRVFTKALDIIKPGYSISFLCNGDDSPLIRISDDELVYNMLEDNVFKYSNLAIFKDNSEDYSEAKKAENSIMKLAYSLQTCNTPLDVFVSRYDLITKLVDYQSCRPYKIIERIAHKIPYSSSHISKHHDTLVWFKDDTVASLLSVSKSNIKVVLSPFSIKNYEPVDVDIVSKYRNS